MRIVPFAVGNCLEKKYCTPCFCTGFAFENTSEIRTTPYTPARVAPEAAFDRVPYNTGWPNRGYIVIPNPSANLTPYSAEGRPSQGP